MQARIRCDAGRKSCVERGTRERGDRGLSKPSLEFQFVTRVVHAARVTLIRI